jgi:predicted SprT family Zn-dependent metalloprotease
MNGPVEQERIANDGLRLLAAEELNRLIALHPVGFTPRLVWKRLRVSAGIAKWHQRTIVLSKRLLTSEDRLVDTLRHEYAHFMAIAAGGLRASGHGACWRQAMRDLGQEPEVFHHYPVVRNARRQRVEYLCERCGVTIVRHRRLNRGYAYRHAKCGGAIRIRSVRTITGDGLDP